MHSLNWFMVMSSTLIHLLGNLIFPCTSWSIFTCWLRSWQTRWTLSAWFEKVISQGCSSSFSARARVVFSSCRAAAVSFTLPTTAWKTQTEPISRLMTAAEQTVQTYLCFLLTYLPLLQSLTSQSLTGGLFPLTQLLFLPLDPSVKIL